MTAELAVKSIENACLNVNMAKDIILHSNMGSQYISQKFEDYLDNKHMIHSFSRKGNSYDNACIESFHSLLKKAVINRRKYYNFNTAQKVVLEYMNPGTTEKGFIAQ